MKHMKLTIALIVGAMSILWFVISYRTTLEVDLGNIESPLNTVVGAGGSTLDPSGKNGTVYKIKLRPGTHTITIKNPGYNILNEKVTLGMFGSKYSPTLTKVDEKNAAIYSYNGVGGVKYKNEKFFANNTWVVFVVEPENNDYDGAIVASKLDSDGNWKVILEGSNLDFDAALEPLPEDVKLYMESL